jgi:hypothetical protein
MRADHAGASDQIRNHDHSTALPQPVPKNLREQRVSFIANAPEERLPDLHRRLLIAERDELWKEIGVHAQTDFEAGKFVEVEESAREYAVATSRCDAAGWDCPQPAGAWEVSDVSMGCPRDSAWAAWCPLKHAALCGESALPFADGG